jgi:hypothetical protein
VESPIVRKVRRKFGAVRIGAVEPDSLRAEAAWAIGQGSALRTVRLRRKKTLAYFAYGTIAQRYEARDVRACQAAFQPSEV